MDAETITVSPGAAGEADAYSGYANVEPLFLRFAALPADDPARTSLKDQLLTAHLPLSQHLARRYANRGEPLEDLIQVARVGLIKAVDRFDPSRGVEFLPYAVPTITGELRRHFRDSGWDVRIPRRLQELNLRLTTATNELSQLNGRAPTASELAAHLDLPREEIVEGLQARNAYSSKSLDLPSGPENDAPSLAESLGEEDQHFEAVENRETLIPLLASLPERERKILRLRFFQDLTQTQIAQEIGVSQMHVSRLLASTLTRLRTQLLADD